MNNNRDTTEELEDLIARTRIANDGIVDADKLEKRIEELRAEISLEHIAIQPRQRDELVLERLENEGTEHLSPNLCPMPPERLARILRGEFKE